MANKYTLEDLNSLFDMLDKVSDVSAPTVFELKAYVAVALVKKDPDLLEKMVTENMGMPIVHALFVYPFEDLPLKIGMHLPISKRIIQWRLKIGR